MPKHTSPNKALPSTPYTPSVRRVPQTSTGLATPPYTPAEPKAAKALPATVYMPLESDGWLSPKTSLPLACSSCETEVWKRGRLSVKEYRDLTKIVYRRHIHCDPDFTIPLVDGWTPADMLDVCDLTAYDLMLLKFKMTLQMRASGIHTLRQLQDWYVVQSLLAEARDWDKAIARFQDDLAAKYVVREFLEEAKKGAEWD